jgi:hypothetical protein
MKYNPNFKKVKNHWSLLYSITDITILAFENRSYLGEFKAELKKALARESGAQGVLFDEKNRGSKIS